MVKPRPFFKAGYFWRGRSRRKFRLTISKANNLPTFKTNQPTNRRHTLSMRHHGTSDPRENQRNVTSGAACQNPCKEPPRKLTFFEPQNGGAVHDFKCFSFSKWVIFGFYINFRGSIHTNKPEFNWERCECQMSDVFSNCCGISRRKQQMPLFILLSFQ